MCTTVLAPGPQRPMKQARQRGTPSTTMCTPCATASAQLRHGAAASVAACAASRLSWRACTRAVSSAMRAAAVAAETSAPPPPAKVAGRMRRIRVVAQITRGGRNGTRERRKGHERRAVRVGGGMECGRELRTACIFVAAHRSGVVVCTLSCKCAGRMLTHERRKGHERRAVRVGGGMECGRELRTARGTYMLLRRSWQRRCRRVQDHLQ